MQQTKTFTFLYEYTFDSDILKLYLLRNTTIIFESNTTVSFSGFSNLQRKFNYIDHLQKCRQVVRLCKLSNNYQ